MKLVRKKSKSRNLKRIMPRKIASKIHPKVVCVIHLPPLPGSPLYEGMEVEDIVNFAINEVESIIEGGADGIILENYNDKPYPVKANPETIATMSVICREACKKVRKYKCFVGINILRNDAIASLAISKAIGADFIRVNQLIYPSIAPEGILFPNPSEVARYKKFINCNAEIFADLNVKHAHHFVSLEDYAENFERSLADVAIVTGSATGKPINLDELKFFKNRLECPVYVGSGVTPEFAKKISGLADGVIVGTYLKSGGSIDSKKVEEIVKAFD